MNTIFHRTPLVAASINKCYCFLALKDKKAITANLLVEIIKWISYIGFWINYSTFLIYVITLCTKCRLRKWDGCQCSLSHFFSKISVYERGKITAKWRSSCLINKNKLFLNRVIEHNLKNLMNWTLRKKQMLEIPLKRVFFSDITVLL